MNTENNVKKLQNKTMNTKTILAKTFLVAALLLAGSQSGLNAQQYSVGWSATLGGGGSAVTGLGGGGTMTGGQYSLAASIGQVGAGGPTGGGQYILNGGFWEVPGGPDLSIQFTAPDTLTLSWPMPALGCFVLQQTASVDPLLINWVDVPNPVTFANGMDQVVVTVSGSTEFYRLLSPCQ